MDSLIIAVAKYLLYVMVVGVALVWVFREDRRGKLDLVGAAVIGLILVGIFIVIAGALHNDPRPFMPLGSHPESYNLLHHAPGNGFPSDHSCAAGLMAGIVALRHRLYGAILAVAAILIAVARVAAHAHHVQDVVAGLILGGIAAWLGTLLASWLITRFDVAARLGIAQGSSNGPTATPR